MVQVTVSTVEKGAKPGKLNTSIKKHRWLLGCLIAVLFIVLAIVLINKTRKENLSDTTLVAKVNRYSSLRENQAAINLINKQQNSKDSFDQNLLATVYANAGDYSKALTIYDQLSRTHSLSQDNAESAANLAAQVHEPTLAINYYKQAISIAQANTANPLAKADTNYYRQQIHLLQEGHGQ